jgi:hypothetical protein
MRVIYLLILSLNLTSACTQKSQYEIYSPCVSNEAKNSWIKNPCVRRPANQNIA